MAKYNHAPFSRISYATEKLGRIGWFMTLAWLSWLQEQSVLRLWLAWRNCVQAWIPWIHAMFFSSINSNFCWLGCGHLVFLCYIIESFSFKSWHCPCNCNPLVSSCQSGAGSTCKPATKLGLPFGLFHLPIRFFAKGSVVLVEFPYWSCCLFDTSWYSVSLRIFGTARMYIIIHIRMHIHIHIRTQCIYIYDSIFL